MSDRVYDYGRKARIGVATPQANPTVEAEFSVLYPRAVSIQASRLVSKAANPLARLTAYFEELEDTLGTYSGMHLSAFGFACTGSSYLVGAEREDEACEKLSEQFGYPVETAARAILARLKAENINRITIVMPYPQPLVEAAVAYWRSRDLEVVSAHRVETRTADTTTIYELTSQDATEALKPLDTENTDAILLSGTGMPTLACIAGSKKNLPVLSSNYCLAWRLLELAGASELISEDGLDISGWEARLAECAP
ncbi:hypothetical protein [Parvularcula marina]|uniref:maleate cis-trans isomerase family protein n=1 Tax=Parvularcula marina TaxID=2292771 RepID=UPI0035169E53